MPTKAAFLSLEYDSDLEFDHFLALKLGMTVAEMRTRMSHSEYVRWTMYFAREAQRIELENAKQGG